MRAQTVDTGPYFFLLPTHFSTKKDGLGTRLCFNHATFHANYSLDIVHVYPIKFECDPFVMFDNLPMTYRSVMKAPRLHPCNTRGMSVGECNHMHTHTVSLHPYILSPDGCVRLYCNCILMMFSHNVLHNSASVLHT